MKFDALEKPGLFHVFTLRGKTLEQVLATEKISSATLVFAEQIHSNHVAVVSFEHRGQAIAGADALITREPDICLVILTADCGSIFLYDSVQRAIGLVHSGKKGTELDILTKTIEAMEKNFKTKPSNLQVVLAPCIRPPHYEIDFAADIARQAERAGVKQFHDCGFNTGNDLSRFYSYRVEKGQPKRHYSMMCLLNP